MTSIKSGDLTPEAFQGELSELGWCGQFPRDDPEVAQLRQQLIDHAGIPDIELVDPTVPGFAQRAADLLERDGYVVVRDVLDAERLATIRRGCEIAIREMVGRDDGRVGNRGSHRYSFGGAPAHFKLQPFWSVLIDPPPLMEVMEAIFGTKDFVTNSGSGGGDFNIPGSTEYQHLHSDSSNGPRQGDVEYISPGMYADVKLEYLSDGQKFGPWIGGERRRVPLDHPEDPARRYEIVNGRDLPAREHTVTVNYPLEVRFGSTVGHTPCNGATRQVPGTASSWPIPTEDEEPLWMKMSVTSPCPAGSAMIRDDRAWHGGTPNLSDHVRAIPHPGSYMLPNHPAAPTAERRRVSLSRDIFDGLTPQGQHICRYIVAADGESVPDVQWKPDWHGLQGGVGGENARHKGEVVDNPFRAAAAGAKL
jgi:hypothetical protein